MGILNALSIFQSPQKDPVKVAAGEAGAIANKVKAQRVELRENMGMFGEMMQFLKGYEELKLAERKQFLEEFKMQQSMIENAQDTAYSDGVADGAVEATATSPEWKRSITYDPESMSVEEYAYLNLIEMAKDYAPALLSSAKEKGENHPLPPPSITEGEAKLREVNKLLGGMGIDLAQIDAGKVTLSHAQRLKSLYNEIRE